MTSNKRPKKKVSRRRRRIKDICKLVFLMILVLITVLGAFFYFKYGDSIMEMKTEAEKTIQASTPDTFKSSLTSLVYASDGSLLAKLKSEKEVYYLDYSNIPQYALNAMLVTEDKKFFKHNGVDYKSILRAGLALIKNKGEIRQGASTITQQLARNVFLTSEVSFKRKIKEMFYAIEIEKKYSKTQILEFYFNNMYFANGYYGLQAASNGYFSKSISELSLSQIAFLCAIPNNPTLHNPLTYFENTLERRDKILDQMYNDKKITWSEYKKAKAETITLLPATSEKQNFAESYTYHCAIRALMAADGFVFQNEFASDAAREAYEDRYYEKYYELQKSLYTSGYRIYTSIDLAKQEELQKSIDNELAGFTETRDDGIYALQGAATCIDNDTGRVVAIIGGRDQDVTGYTLNRAYQSYRQPGSSIKPLIVYTPWFERGLTPNSIVNDAKIEGGPRNADNTYAGNMTVRRAVEVSKNTVAWNLFTELTPKVGLSYLVGMNFSKITKDDYYPAASLGGLTYGVSSVEMASAYAAIENYGIYREPTCIVKITDSKGNILVSDEVNEKQVYEGNAALIMTDVLKGVMTSGTGRKLQLTNMPCAGKTGTTTDRKDGWFVGYTRYYTTSVWVGYDYPRTVSDLAGSTYPGRIWHAYMSDIHENLEPMEFDEPFLMPGATATPHPTKEPDPTEDPALEELPEVTPEEEMGEDSNLPDGEITPNLPEDTVSPTPESGEDNLETPTLEPTKEPTQVPTNTVTPTPVPPTPTIPDIPVDGQVTATPAITPTPVPSDNDEGDELDPEDDLWDEDAWLREQNGGGD